MRVFNWNCRDLGKPSAILQCQKKALESKPDVMFLMETQLAEDRDKVAWDKRSFSEGWELPREGLSGGLLLAWIPRQSLRIVYTSKHLVHTDMLDNCL